MSHRADKGPLASKENGLWHRHEDMINPFMGEIGMFWDGMERNKKIISLSPGKVGKSQFSN